MLEEEEARRKGTEKEGREKEGRKKRGIQPEKDVRSISVCI
jgi:hypothetical protein